MRPRALLSVSDKSGLVEFAQALTGLGYELVSTGGTQRLLSGAAVAAREVADVTGFPEIMDGRVKTLHPKIHGGILGRRGTDDAVMREHGIAPIDLVVVNLYPFAQTVAQPGCTRQDAIENIDVGGPAMVRAAAKNHAHVAVVVDPSDYPRVLDALRKGPLQQDLREQLAAKAFAHTAAYDAQIACYLAAGLAGGGTAVAPFPATLALAFDKRMDLRYGENPHQRGAFYVESPVPAGTIASAKILQGKELSYNNIADADAALECVKQFADPACVIVKHANPCGVAVDIAGINAAYERAYATDKTSAYGGIIAFNRELDGGTLQAILDRQFVEVIVAPSISAGAAQRAVAKPNVRLLATGAWPATLPGATDYTRVAGGLLVQDADLAVISPALLKVVTKRAPTAAEIEDLLFAWQVAKFVKSNAIVYARERRTIGIGAGQMSRVYSAKIAGIKAADEKLEVRGSVMASDAFFPFRDTVDGAAASGIEAIIQPGGSMRDAEVIAAADEHGLTMVFTGIRHFRH